MKLKYVEVFKIHLVLNTKMIAFYYILFRKGFY